MTTAEIAANVAAWAVQMAVVAAAAAAAQAVMPIDRPRARLAYWQAVLALGLLLPFLQPWIRPAGPFPPAPLALALRDPGHEPASGAALLAAAPISPTSAPVAEPAPAPTVASTLASVDRAALFLWTLIAGAAGFAARLAFGLFALRRVRRRSIPLSPEAIEPRGAAVELRLSRDVSSPVTFGLRRPVIVLPEVFETLDDDEKRSVVCHELVHVERRDWAVQVAEEVLRALFWFHPAFHWLVGRVRLAREQAVDAEVVRRLGRRAVYLEALVRLAAGPRRAALLAASPMLGRSSLAERVDLLLKEKPMPKSRVLVSLASSAAAIALAALGATVVAPLRGTVRAADERPRATLPPVAPAAPVAPVAPAEVAPGAPVAAVAPVAPGAAVPAVPAVPAAPAPRAARAAEADGDHDGDRRSGARSVESEHAHLAQQREELEEARRAIEEARRELQVEMRRLREELSVQLREELTRLRESGALRELGEEARRTGAETARLGSDVGVEFAAQAREIAEEVRREMERVRADMERERQNEARQRAHEDRERAMGRAEREAQEKARAEALERAHEAIEKAREEGRRQEQQARAQARAHEERAREQAMKAEKRAREAEEKARMEQAAEEERAKQQERTNR